MTMRLSAQPVQAARCLCGHDLQVVVAGRRNGEQGKGHGRVEMTMRLSAQPVQAARSLCGHIFQVVVAGRKEGGARERKWQSVHELLVHLSLFSPLLPHRISPKTPAHSNHLTRTLPVKSPTPCPRLPTHLPAHLHIDPCLSFHTSPHIPHTLSLTHLEPVVRREGQRQVRHGAHQRQQ